MSSLQIMTSVNALIKFKTPVSKNMAIFWKSVFILDVADTSIYLKQTTKKCNSEIRGHGPA